MSPARTEVVPGPALALAGKVHDDATCDLSLIGSDMARRARLSPSMIHRGVCVHPGDLLQIDFALEPPVVVYRWRRAQVVSREGSNVSVAVPGEPVSASSTRTAWTIRAVQPPPAPGELVFLDEARDQPVVVDTAHHGLPAHPDRFLEQARAIRDEVAALTFWRRRAGRPHDDAIEIPEALVRRLLQSQFPEWSGLPLRCLVSTGTVHAMFRLGDDMVVRLPLIPRFHTLDIELRWLPWLRTRLPLALPEPLAEGRAEHGYRWRWAVFRWLEGDSWLDHPPGHPCAAAVELAAFLRALWSLHADGGPMAGAGAARASLAERDHAVRSAILASYDLFDTSALVAAWDEAVRLPPWQGPPVWVHGDLLGGNLLTAGGRLSGVVDWGSAGVGDPARDLMAAWTVFSGDSRRVFRDHLGVDQATWRRAWGQALTRVCGIPYYWATNPRFAQDSLTTVIEALADDPARW